LPTLLIFAAFIWMEHLRRKGAGRQGNIAKQESQATG
jgi:hypothetical protein